MATADIVYITMQGCGNLPVLIFSSQVSEPFILWIRGGVFLLTIVVSFILLSPFLYIAL